MQSRSRGATAGWWTLFGFLSFLMVVIGSETALHFRGPAIDGPFQLYNSLRRIAAGQRGGVDFQFFHGLGIPYLHYVQFRLLGGDFFASEITRQLTSAVVYPLTAVIFLWFFIRDWTRVAAWSAIVMALSIGLRMTSLLVAVNSLLGIRSALPVLMPVALCLHVPRGWRVAITGVLLGLTLVMGSEQGLATLLALVLATVIVAWRSSDGVAYLVDTAAAVAIGVATLALALIAIGGVSGMRAALTYNFRLVPLDQYWYFGTPPNLFLSRWSVVPRMLMTIPRMPLTVLVGLATVVLCSRRLWRVPNVPETREHFACTVLALYGLISCASLLGTYVNAYIQPLLRVLLLLGAVYLDRFFVRRDASLGRTPLFGASGSILQIAVAALLLMVAVLPSTFTAISVTMPHFVRDHLIRGERATYSGIWPETMIVGQSVYNAHRNPDGSPPTLWSTYAGLLEARNGVFHPSFDYVIHALGPVNRARYLDDFRRERPRLVQTVRPIYTQYESWIEATSWDFYADLLQNYQLAGETPWSFFWVRRPTPSPGAHEVWSADIAPGASSVQLPAAPGNADVILLEAELFYSVRNPLRVLPVIGALPRYLVTAENAAQLYPITLDPFVASSRIPIVAYRGKGVRLSWEAFSLLGGAGIAVTRVRLSFVPVSDINVPWLAELHARQTGHGPDQ